MLGLPERTIVMDCENAKDYVKAKITLLLQEKEDLEAQLENVKFAIEEEMSKLEMLNNPPVKRQCICCQ